MISIVRFKTVSQTMEELESRLEKLVINGDDKYNEDMLKKRYINFKKYYESETELILNKVPLRHINLPEDITENITKFIIKKYEDDSIVWCKGINKSGDLYSKKFSLCIEVKAFSSTGPTQFGPKCKFDKLYFLDFRKFTEDRIILWKVNINDSDQSFLNLKVNKDETLKSQQNMGRRPRIKFSDLYTQISHLCEKIYDGTFENIF